MITLKQTLIISEGEQDRIKKDIREIRKKKIEVNASDITVVIPNYNNADILEKVIISILEQEYVDLKLRIVDNHSTDRSWEIIQEFQKNYRNIEALRMDINCGPHNTANKILQGCATEYTYYASGNDIIQSKDSTKTIT